MIRVSTKPEPLYLRVSTGVYAAKILLTIGLVGASVLRKPEGMDLVAAVKAPFLFSDGFLGLSVDVLCAVQCYFHVSELRGRPYAQGWRVLLANASIAFFSFFLIWTSAALPAGRAFWGGWKALIPALVGAVALAQTVRLFLRTGSDTTASALRRLVERPSNATRIAFYRSLKEGVLWLAALEPVAAWGPAPMVLDEAKRIKVLTSIPEGGGRALLVFTDAEAARARNRECDYFAVSAPDALRLALGPDFTELVVNPAENWACIIREDVERILRGDW